MYIDKKIITTLWIIRQISYNNIYYNHTMDYLYTIDLIIHSVIFNIIYITVYFIQLLIAIALIKN